MEGGGTFEALSTILRDLTKTFDKIEYTIIPRAQDQFANALTTLAPWLKYPNEFIHDPWRLSKVMKK